MNAQQLIINGIQNRKGLISANITSGFKEEKKHNYSNLILMNSQDQILFLRRANIDSFGPGKWCVPGGKIEDFENPKQAAVRETIEETRIPLTIRDMQKIMFVKEVKKVGFTIYYYAIQLSNDFDDNITLDSNEHQQYCWKTVLEALAELNLLLDVGEHLKSIFKVKE